MEQLTALKPFPYARKSLKPGDDFEASSKDARILIVIGKARRRVEAPAPVIAKAKRTYKRKDLTAE